MQILEELAKWLNESPWVNLFSFSLGLLGIFLSIVFYIRSKKEVYPRYQTAGVSLIASGTKSIQGLRILHNENSLKYLSVATVSFWNQGNKVLESNDIAGADPLRIVFPPSTNIIQAKLVDQSTPGNNVQFSASPNNPALIITFDYLARNEGCTFEIFHDAQDADCASVIGSIKGFGSPQRVAESDDIITDSYMMPLLGKVIRIIGGTKTFTFWILVPILFIPFALTMMIDILLKPFQLLFGPPKKLNAYIRAKKYQ